MFVNAPLLVQNLKFIIILIHPFRDFKLTIKRSFISIKVQFKVNPKSESKGNFPLLEQFLTSFINFFSLKVVDRQAFCDSPLASRPDPAREGVHDSLGNTIIISVTDHCHASMLESLSAVP